MDFTIAITVFEQEYFLPHALETALAQTLPALEIRIYSDGPSSATAAIVAALPSNVRVTYDVLERRPGLHGNHLRRRALEEARGAHVCFLGHDCLLFPTYLQTHADNLAGDAEGLSVVPVAYWRQWRKDPSQPRYQDLMGLKEGEIDLLCIAFPRVRSLAAGCFGEPMERLRYADFLAFDQLRQQTPPRFQPVSDQAAHF